MDTYNISSANCLNFCTRNLLKKPLKTLKYSRELAKSVASMFLMFSKEICCARHRALNMEGEMETFMSSHTFSEWFHTIFLVLLQEFIQSMIYFFLLGFVRS